MLTAQPRTTTFCSNIQHVLNLRRPDVISGVGRNDRARRRATPFPGLRRPIIQAVVRGGDSKATVEEAAGKVMEKGLEGLMESGTSIDVRAVITIRKKMRERLVDKIEDQWISFINGIGRGILIQLISEDIDPVTQSGKSSEWSYVRGFPKTSENNPYIVEYAADLRVPRDFGCPGAALITNFLDREVYLVQIVVHGFSQGPLFFSANTWIHSSKDNPTESRIIFKNQAYLPSQTPLGIKGLRSADLMSIRGNGKGERKLYERIYDYEVYNDLGNPDKDEDLARPVLGGKEWPYPRRCRTGRPATKTDPATETRIEKPNPVYVPRDEAFGEIKQDTFSAGKLKAALHNLIPLIASTLSSSDIPFNCFSDIDKLYIDGFLLRDGEEANANIFSPNMMTQLFSAGKGLFKYEIPAEVPILSKLDPAVYGPPESAITKDIIEKQLTGMTVEEAIAKKRLFIIDYHDMLLPFMEKMNSLAGKKAYATRTIFLYTPSATLMPIIIELSLPHRNKRVLTHDSDATSYWIWKQAKAHVCSNDAGVHQLVNHWLRTHASMEPYIIATQRQLSSMHPIYKLLHPHMRYTIEINALARQSLINGGGIIEACFSPGKYSMEISSAAYKTMWRFDMEALPADLVRRGMAEEDPSAPCGVKLVIEDYPYAADGLLIWAAIKELVESYVDHYYSSDHPSYITSDTELQDWWSEIKNIGHADKKHEPWWPSLNTKHDLSAILTTIIWVASGQHAAINFGQYPFGGYVPNRPTLMRRLIPQEQEQDDYNKFLLNPQQTFLSSLPTQLQATKVMAVQDTLSTHSPDEEYLHQLYQLQSSSIIDPHVLNLFATFSAKLEEIEDTINQRNKDKNLKNRSGAGIPPYELLMPSSPAGVTGRGVPNSISI